MSNQQKEYGFFETLLALAGGFTGFVFGYDIAKEIGGIIGAVVLWIIGRWIGAAADGLVKAIFLILVLVLNRFVRLLILELVQALLG